MCPTLMRKFSKSQQNDRKSQNLSHSSNPSSSPWVQCRRVELNSSSNSSRCRDIRGGSANVALTALKIHQQPISPDKVDFLSHVLLSICSEALFNAIH